MGEDRHGVVAVQALIEKVSAEVAVSCKRVISGAQTNLRVLANVCIAVECNGVIARASVQCELPKMSARYSAHVVTAAQIDLCVFADGDITADGHRIDAPTAL